MPTVAVNPPKTPVTKGSSGIAAATLPNVCKMPGPPAPFVPTPLPNIGKSDNSPQGYSTTVTFEGQSVAIKGATFNSIGDAGVPYVCGYAGQVYTLSDGRWIHMDDGLVEPKGKVDSIALEGIHGTSARDIYVVGSRGTLAHWNGRAWTRVPLHVDGYLAGVRALSKTHVVAVGDDGVFVEWDGKSWSVQRIPGYEQSLLSDVEWFDGKLYVAAVGQLLVRKPSGWAVVKTRLKEKPEFIRLAVGDGRLWAMGAKRVHSFDGLKWTAHVDPDNG